MSRICLVAALLFFPILLLAQNHGAWVKYEDAKGEKSGYKDQKGVVRVPAQFNNIPAADTFHHIIAVVDTQNKGYYLLKNGKRVGRDSVYVWDFTFDCEQEGKILFYDKAHDKVGFFDSNGVAVIPAIYDRATPFHNGIALVLKGGKRKCLGESGDCEHWTWEGGTGMLINSQNEVVVADWEETADNINWYSMRVNDPHADTALCTIVRGQNGNSYSFVRYNKEFEKWFYSVFLKALVTGKSENIRKFLFPVVTHWSDKEHEWLQESGQSFINTNYQLLANKLKNCSKENASIFNERLNSFIFTNKRYLKYRNSCGEHDAWKYQIFNVVKTSYSSEKEMEYQEHFEFIRTELGYALHSVSYDVQ